MSLTVSDGLGGMKAFFCTYKLLLERNLLKLKLLELGRGGSEQRSCGEDVALHLDELSRSKLGGDMERKGMYDELDDVEQTLDCGNDGWRCCCWEDGAEEGNRKGDDTSGGRWDED